MLRTTITRALALGFVAAMASIGLVAATPGSGAVPSTLATGILDAGVKIRTDDLRLSTRDDVQVVTQSITIAPGGHTGWHSHPGPVFVTIAAGSMAFYDGDRHKCKSVIYETGESFIDRGGGHVHIARNEGITNLVLLATYLVPVGAPVRTDVPNPGICPF
jgi:quercetin dioxygenase-like cupin family protein